MAILKVTTDATTLEALLTGKARLASWRNWPQTEVLELRDPFHNAVPCFDWTPEAWKAVDWASTHIIRTPFGFKLH